MERVGVLGASGLVGGPLLRQLVSREMEVVAYARGEPTAAPGVEWRGYDAAPRPAEYCISLVPLPLDAGMLAFIAGMQPRRVVQFSSTSRFTKSASPDAHEVAIARRLAEGEAAFCQWAEAQGIQWTILQPTAIYELGRDRNVTDIARFIRRFGFFPLLGKATGLRQPVAARDAADAAILASRALAAANGTYTIAGGEVLSYREMVRRIFQALDRRPLFLPVPLAAFSLAVAALRRLPRYHHLTTAMAERMNADLVFDNGPAERDFAYRPGPFQPGP